MIAVALICIAADVRAQTAGQVAPSAQNQNAASSIVLRWSARNGVNRYRLQVARDEKFDDIILDRAVVGSEYRVTDLTSGEYFWRVAPAAGETGEYSGRNLVTLTNGVAAGATTMRNTETPTATITEPRESLNPTTITSANSGWRTATGEVLHPVVAALRSSASLDVVGANADGTVFAIDGVSGIPLWTTRYKPRLLRGETIDRERVSRLTPFVVKGEAEKANVVVAFDEGVRLLEGATGRELWRAVVAGKIIAGTSVDISRDGKPEVLITTAQPATFKMLDPTDGRIIGSTALPATSIGAIEVMKDETAGNRVILALEDGSLIIINTQGDIERIIKLDARLTTSPRIVTSNVTSDKKAMRKLMLVGVEGGLVALDGVTLEPLWRVAMEADAPQGEITVTDFENDGVREAVFVTNRNRIVAVNLTDGKIKWSSDEARDAAGVALADANGDGIQDVLIPGKDDFAVALSGRDGEIVWRGIEAVNNAATIKKNRATIINGKNAPRQFIIASPSGSNARKAYIVGNDASRVNLRAYQLPL